MLANIQTFNCLRKDKFGIEVGVVRVTAVPSPKTGINGELREVC